MANEPVESLNQFKSKILIADQSRVGQSGTAPFKSFKLATVSKTLAGSEFENYLTDGYH